MMNVGGKMIDVPAASIANILLTKLEYAELLIDSPLAPHTEEYLRGYADAVVAMLLELSEHG